MSDHDPIADLREYLEGWETGEIEEPWRAFKAAVPDAIRAFDGQALKLTEALAEAARLRAALEAHRRALIDVTRAAAVALIGNQLADGPKRDGLVKAAYRATQVLEPCPELESPAAPRRRWSRPVPRRTTPSTTSNGPASAHSTRLPTSHGAPSRAGAPHATR